MPWNLYIIRCRDDSIYIGITQNLELRLKKHNHGYGSQWTKQRRPVKIIYAEKYPNYRLCRKRELQLKNWSRKKKENLIKGLKP